MFPCFFPKFLFVDLDVYRGTGICRTVLSTLHTLDLQSGIARSHADPQLDWLP